MSTPREFNGGGWWGTAAELLRHPEQMLGWVQVNGIAISAAVLAGAAVTAVRSWLWRWQSHRLTRGARLIDIAVPPKVEDGSAAAWWTHLMGLTAPAWKRLLLGQPHVTFEYIADHRGVRFQVWVPGPIPEGLVEKAIRSAWPGATLSTRPASPPVPPDAPAAGGRLVLGRPEEYPLATDHSTDPLRALLGAASGLNEGDHVAVQVSATPVAGRRLLRAYRTAAALRTGRSATFKGELFDLLTPGQSSRRPTGELSRLYPERTEQVRAVLGKAAHPRFAVRICYAVATTRRDGGQARAWLRGHGHEIASTFALFTGSHQFLRRRRLANPAVHLAARRLDRGFLLSVPELAALAHLPYDLAAPGVTRAGARPVPPAPAIPATGPDIRTLGDSEAGTPRPVGLPVASARQHLHVIGQTGVGKSTFLGNLVLGDAAAGRGALVIDPKGDLITDILHRLPERAIDRTVVFDPAAPGPPPCLNVLAGTDPAFAVESIVTTFRRCFASAWGPRLDDLLRSACLTLVHVNGTQATLADIPRLLAETSYRARITKQLTEGLLTGFWASYDELTPAARAATISPVMNKLRAVLLRPFIRAALSGGPSTVDLAHLLNTGGLILARLPKGVLGEDAVRLFGSLLLAQTWQAITPRARQSEHQRRDAAAYIDEAHNFLNLPGSLGDILAEARAYRLSLVLAHQHLSQLPKDLRDAVSADARNKIYFATSPEDAADLSRHTTPLLTPHDLTHLGAFQAAGRLMDGSAPTPAFTFRTRPLPEAIPNRADQVRRASREQFAATDAKRDLPAVGLRDLDGGRPDATPTTAPAAEPALHDQEESP